MSTPWRFRSVTVSVALVVALGVGANVAVLSVLRPVVIGSVPFADVGRLAVIENRGAYDLAGRKLAQLASGRMSAGEHPVTWNFRDEKGVPISVGYYVVKLRVGDKVFMQRGIRIR